MNVCVCEVMPCTCGAMESNMETCMKCWDRPWPLDNCSDCAHEFKPKFEPFWVRIFVNDRRDGEILLKGLEGRIKRGHQIDGLIRQLKKHGIGV